MILTSSKRYNIDHAFHYESRSPIRTLRSAPARDRYPAKKARGRAAEDWFFAAWEKFGALIVPKKIFGAHPGGEQEDHLGIDGWVSTYKREVPVQIKSSIVGLNEFRERTSKDMPLVLVREGMTHLQVVRRTVFEIDKKFPDLELFGKKKTEADLSRRRLQSERHTRP